MAAELSHSEVWTASGATNGGFGNALATGDFDGDGLTDLVIAEIHCGEEGTSPGCVYVYTGSAESFESTASWTIAGATANQMTGNRLSSGDVNQDGFDDLLVTPGATGSSELYLGSGAGLDTSAAWVWSGAANGFVPDGVIVGDMDGDDFLDIAVTDTVSQSIEIHAGDLGLDGPSYTLSNEEHPQFGVHLAAAGSPDGDIFADLLVLTGTESSHDIGAAWLFAGSSQGPIAEAVWSYEEDQEQLGPAFGWTGGGVGDINGDGIDDFAISALGISPDGSDEEPVAGVVAIWQGKTVGPETVPDTMITYGGEEDAFGWAFVGGVDLTDNTFDDLLVSAPDYSSSSPETGSAVIHQGAFAGLEESPVHALASADEFESVVVGYSRSLAVAADEGTSGKLLVVIGSPDNELGAVYAYSLSTDDDKQPGANPNTSEPKGKDGFAESQCGCAVGSSSSFAGLMLLPLLARRRRS